MNFLTNLALFLGTTTTEDKTPIIGGEEASQLWETVVKIVTIVVWILVAILGIVLVVKGITTALAVVKAADEPQVRQEKISSFKYLAIGVGIALVIATLAGTLLSVFGKKLTEQLSGIGQ